MKNKLINRLKKRKERRLSDLMRKKYIEYYEKLSVDETIIFLEARNGKEIDGNIYYIAKVLFASPDFAGYRVYVSAEDEKKARIIKKKLNRISRNGGAEGPEIIIVESKEYYRICATAKYIICDSTLKNFFMKKEGQIYLNVWHGTPFKVMGKRVVHEPHAIGNAQKNFVIADYLLYPNEYMMKHMVEDYMIADVSRARILLGGYPRNSIFFDEENRKLIESEYNPEGKRVYVYMPTYRPEQMGDYLNVILKQMDELLSEDEILFAKVHPLAASKIDFERFDRVKAFPENFETYEFLHLADCLITDYSSVFYDFAVTGKKIVLFTYDEEDYLSTRGLYEPISSLPFPQLKTVQETIEAARTPKDYDDSEFIKKFCSLESEAAADCLCRRVVLGEKSASIRELDMPNNGLENVFVYAGNLSPGHRTDEAMRWLAEADKSLANYYLIFKRLDVAERKETLLNLPEGIRYFGIAGKNYSTGNPEKDREYANRRCFGNTRIDKEIYL